MSDQFMDLTRIFHLAAGGGGGLTCPHCLRVFSYSAAVGVLATSGGRGLATSTSQCPACGGWLVRLAIGRIAQHTGGLPLFATNTTVMTAYPRVTGRAPCPAEVRAEDAELAEDYEEACTVLKISPQASAALSRRCLQHILVMKARVTKKDLAPQIQEVLDSGALPSDLADHIDAIRNVGNFAAHVQKSTNTGEILKVEPHEAEWNLDVLEELFDFYYVRPARRAAKKAQLDARLAEAGKPPMK